MEEKEFIGNPENVDKELVVPTTDEVHSKEVSASTGKGLLSKDDNVQVYEGVMSIAKSLQQSSGGSLGNILQSLGDNHKTSENVPTVARMLGEVVSDFLAGLSKNGDNQIARCLQEAIIKISPHIDISILERLENNADFRLVLDMLAEKVESTDSPKKPTS